MQRFFLQVFVALFVVLPSAAFADGVEERFQRLEQENVQLKEIIKGLQQRLEQLEQDRPVVKGPSEAPKAGPAALNERIAALEKKVDEGSSVSLPGKKVKIGGELELEYRDTQNERNHPAGSTDIPFGQFQIDKFDLDIEAKLADDITLFAQIEAEPGETKLDEAHITFSNLPFNAYLRAGLQYRFIRPSRKTETYPLAGTAFWNDEDLGIEWGGEIAPFYYHLSITNGLRLKDDELGEDDSFPIIQDDDDNRDFNNSKQIGIGIGFKKELLKDHKINLLLFSYFSKLSDDDVVFLQALPGYTADRRTKKFCGGNLEYKFKGLTLFGQYIYARDGGLKRNAWYIQPSFKFPIKGIKYLTSIEPLYRYDRLDLNLSPVVSESLTWDRKRHTFAVITELIKNMKLKLEYNINDEETGGEEVRNNEFVGQLEIGF